MQKNMNPPLIKKNQIAHAIAHVQRQIAVNWFNPIVQGKLSPL
jgi:hypothetical protein